MCPYGCGMERSACMCSDDHIENCEWEEQMRVEYPNGYDDYDCFEPEGCP